MPQCTLMKKSQMPKGGFAKAGGVGAPGDFILLDNEDGTGMILGASGAGNPSDISQVATLTAVSDNPSVVTVDVIGPMQFKESAVGPLGEAKVKFTATWNDGTKTFEIEDGVEVQSSPAQGLLITHDPPVVRQV